MTQENQHQDGCCTIDLNNTDFNSLRYGKHRIHANVI